MQPRPLVRIGHRDGQVQDAEVVVAGAPERGDLAAVVRCAYRVPTKANASTGRRVADGSRVASSAERGSADLDHPLHAGEGGAVEAARTDHAPRAPARATRPARAAGAGARARHPPVRPTPVSTRRPGVLERRPIRPVRQVHPPEQHARHLTPSRRNGSKRRSATGQHLRGHREEVGDPVDEVEGAEDEHVVERVVAGHARAGRPGRRARAAPALRAPGARARRGRARAPSRSAPYPRAAAPPGSRPLPQPAGSPRGRRFSSGSR